MKTKKRESYIPAFNITLLTPFYDPILKWGMREDTFKQYLLDQSHLVAGLKVLDLGCGTGTLTIKLKLTQPVVSLVGVDGDLKVLQIAKEKSLVANQNIEWNQGLAHFLPYPDCSFDRVISSLMIHHLTAANKIKAFQEVYRILKPGGEFHLLDFTKPTRWMMRLISIPIGRMEEADDNIRGLLPEMLQKAGMSKFTDTHHFYTIFGELAHYQIQKTYGELKLGGG